MADERARENWCEDTRSRRSGELRTIYYIKSSFAFSSTNLVIRSSKPNKNNFNMKVINDEKNVEFENTIEYLKTTFDK